MKADFAYLFRWPTALQIAALLSGCASQGELVLVDPAKYLYHNCVQLERAMTADRKRAVELKGLQAKAAREQVGAVIGNITYGPEYEMMVGDMKLIERTSRDKECEPPIVVGAAFTGR